MTTIAQALQQATDNLLQRPATNPRLEAELLLAFLLDKPRTHLLAWPEKRLGPKQLNSYLALIKRRLHGEPIAHITGQREFWSLPLEVTADTLIPRPETELLVERALQLTPKQESWQIADLGTGSGAIAAAISSERPRCHLIATDRSPEALRIAGNNFRKLGLTHISTAIGTWCAALPEGEPFDLIVSNPPYIPEQDPHLKQGDLPREPQHALCSGHDGLDDICLIIQQVPAHLAPGGHLLLEHGYDQGTRVRELFKAAGFTGIQTHHDLAGQERLSEGVWNDSPGEND